MTKLYKHFKVASKTAISDAASIDGVEGFAHVADLRVASVIEAAAFSWLPGQRRTMKLVRVIGGEFGIVAEDGAAFPAHAQRLFSTEASAREAFSVMRAAYGGADSKWVPVNA